MRHVIQKSNLHVEFDGPEAEAAGLQRRLQRFCYDCLLPAMEVTFNAQVPEDEHLLLDELHIDAGTIPLERLEAELTQAVRERLQRSLREELAAPREQSRRRNSIQTLTEAFLHFLENGSLPWWFQLPAGKELEEVLLNSSLADYFKDAGITRLEMALVTLRKEQALSRLILQFSDRFHSLLLPMIAPRVGKRVDAVLERLAGLALPAAVRDRIRELVWREGFSAAAYRTTVTENDLIARALLRFPESVQGRPEVMAALERRRPGATPAVTAEVPLKGKRRAASVRSEPPTAPEQAEAEPAEHGETERDGIYIDNGGMVLLHPYLQRLFEGVDVCHEDRITQPGRGVALLHYLAAGSQDLPEYRLALAKVLCNVPLHAPLARSVELTAEEIEACDSLLAALLTHWGALRNSSADGLRGSFLMRPAKLTLRGNNEWLLQVEKSSYDILLDQLPFSISMVKLPWMPKVLWVEWN